ncbi:MAG: right-handed parallel beta-helix repeat-containing protein [Clostridia bacterium]|nr:right-handed parallel beta-helix repeat-containing protein [Clostridia bacterium]
MTRKELGLIGDGVHDDTAAIQALLDRRGEVYIPDGRYHITRPLILHDDTHLRAARTAVFRLADHANCALLDNDGLYSRTVNRNITVEGGIWDGTHDMQERECVADQHQPCDYDKYVTNSLLVLMMRFVHVERLTVKNLTFKDPTTYAIQIADAKYFTVENITLDYNLTKLNMDGIHIQGPARFGVIRNIMGDANDDHVALCTNGTTRSEVTRGDIEDIDIDGVYCENGYTGVRLLSRGDTLRNVTVRNVHGRFRFFAVSFTHHYPLRDDMPIFLENVHVSDIFASKSHDGELKSQDGALIWFESGIHAKNIIVERVFRRERLADSIAPTVRISKGADVQGLTLRDIVQEFTGEKMPAVSDER